MPMIQERILKHHTRFSLKRHCKISKIASVTWFQTNKALRCITRMIKIPWWWVILVCITYLPSTRLLQLTWCRRHIRIHSKGHNTIKRPVVINSEISMTLAQACHQWKHLQQWMTDSEGMAIRISKRLLQGNNLFQQREMTSSLLLRSLPLINSFDRQASAPSQTNKETVNSNKIQSSSVIQIIFAFRSLNRFHNPSITNKEFIMCTNVRARATIIRPTQLNLVQTTSILWISRALIIIIRLSNTSNSTYINSRSSSDSHHNPISLGLLIVSGQLANRRYKDYIDPNEAQT